MDAVNRIHEFHMQAYRTLHHKAHAKDFSGSIQLRSIGKIRQWLSWHLAPFYRAMKVFAKNWRVHSNIPALCMQLMQFSYRYRVNPESYYRYNLYTNWQRRNDYLYNDEIISVL